VPRDLAEVELATPLGQETLHLLRHKRFGPLLGLGHFQLVPDGSIRISGLHLRAFLDDGGAAEVEGEREMLAASPLIEDEDE
jgi:hypothetical protein